MRRLTLKLLIDGKEKTTLMGEFTEHPSMEGHSLFNEKVSWISDSGEKYLGKFNIPYAHNMLGVIADKLFPDKSYEIRTQVDRS